MAYERMGVIGNIGSIEKKGTPEKPFIKMSVAVDKTTTAGKETIWYQVILTSPAALQRSDELMRLYSKGKRVLVEGDLRLRPYVDRNSQELSVERTIFPYTRPQLI